jgi:hypothetical protein
MVNSVSIGCLNRKEFLAEGSPKSKWTLDVLLKLTEPLWDSGHQRRSAYKADYSNKFLKIVHFLFNNFLIYLNFPLQIANQETCITTYVAI